MASMKYHKEVKRWRAFWYVTLQNGEVDKGSKSFTDKALAQEFKEYCEKRANQIKKTIFVENGLFGLYIVREYLFHSPIRLRRGR